MRRLLAVPLAALMLLQAGQTGAAASAPTGWSAIKDEHLKPVPALKGAHQLQAPLPIPVVNVGQGRTAAADLLNAFITRPYIGYHPATSVFDHCNPDYTLDGKICRFDGAVAVAASGRDPSFSSAYALTPRGGDYMYYDGHNGWDIALNYENLLAAAPGTVRIAGIDPINPCFGQNVVIEHANGFSTRYAHVSTVYVAVGQSVARGQVIAQSGTTGCSTGPHLHFGTYITSSWTAIDPFGWTGAPGADPWPYNQGDLWLTGNPADPLPFAPVNVVATAGNQTASITWQPPTFDGGTPITGYAVTSNPGGLIANVVGGVTTATVPGLTNGTSYTFTVVAMNGVGAGPASVVSNAVVPQSVPGPPQKVTAAPGNQSVTVSWTPPASNGGSPITAYKVTSGAINQTVAGNVTSASFAATANPLTVTVTATNANGPGLPASSNQVTPYPVRQMYTTDVYGGVYPAAASASVNTSASWPGWRIAKASALLPDGSGGYVLDGYGALHPFGKAGLAVGTAYWNGWDIARDVVLLPDSTAARPKGYVLDGFGGLNAFGGAPGAWLSTYWPGWDIAVKAVLLSDGSGGYVMDGYGGLHQFAVGSNPMPPAITNFGYWPGWTIARDIALLPGSTASSVGGVTLDGWGGVHPFGNAGPVTEMAYWAYWDIARSVRFSPASTTAHPQGWVLEGFGGIHPFGGAPVVPGAYWPNRDIAGQLLVQ
jgi:murein DD-endopeptidase MepM/ murein hydrolase activator NlpD